MHILIIEDETGISGFLKQGLEEENYKVTVANNGDSGLKAFNANKPDLVLLDWLMPKMSGLEVCKKIREKNRKVPILFLTAKDTVQETVEGLKAGANDYIKKPFSFEELLERIKIHFRDNSKEEVVKLGPVTLDVLRRKVLVEEREIAFTQREYELLKYLIENKGRVCTRNNIIEDVWGIYFEYDTGVIDVFINAIRKKMNLKKEDDFIKTIRGVGYMIDDANPK
ncbi:response regulator transcription factor [Flavobacterium suncheonense]|uniref:Transcriptional regulator n=1 Tax=Flavobacterium suncheonense GH29-5 = DSM 17707 TaxID=1121899 RepID=A0A0A2MCL5_9FLAO|nr:response regulator transcription factor [Flavobacterium suncheonense]KGO90019.1 transcriptional regulator [Flavobacterium suncheonense GH29-5 = DSM 17707]